MFIIEEVIMLLRKLLLVKGGIEVLEGSGGVAMIDPRLFAGVLSGRGEGEGVLMVIGVKEGGLKAENAVFIVGDRVLKLLRTCWTLFAMETAL